VVIGIRLKKCTLRYLLLVVWSVVSDSSLDPMTHVDFNGDNFSSNYLYQSDIKTYRWQIEDLTSVLVVSSIIRNNISNSLCMSRPRVRNVSNRYLTARINGRDFSTGNRVTESHTRVVRERVADPSLWYSMFVICIRNCDSFTFTLSCYQSLYSRITSMVHRTHKSPKDIKKTIHALL